MQCWLNWTPLSCGFLLSRGLCAGDSDHLQRVSVCLGHHHCYAVWQTHSQPLPEHGQKAPLTVAVLTQDDTGALRHSVQHFMVGHLTWKIETVLMLPNHSHVSTVLRYYFCTTESGPRLIATGNAEFIMQQCLYTFEDNPVLLNISVSFLLTLMLRRRRKQPAGSDLCDVMKG